MNNPTINPNDTRQRMNGKPVHLVPAKSVLNLESGFRHKLLCDGPTFSAGSACAYSCSFCYVPDLMRKSPHLAGVQERHEEVVIRRNGAVQALRMQLLNSRGPRYKDPEDRRVVYGSPLVDVAANVQLAYETVELCRVILENTHWQIRLLSKSNQLPLIARCLAEFKDRMIFGVSTGTIGDKLAASFESGTALVSKRIESLHWLQDHGYRTFGMICPSLPLAGRDYVSFAETMAKMIRADRCEHVWAEVLNIRGESMTRTVKALADGGFGHYAEQVHKVSTDPEAWETYARATFAAHALVYGGATGPDGLPKLRFLQYFTKATRPHWECLKTEGAILL